MGCKQIDMHQFLEIVTRERHMTSSASPSYSCLGFQTGWLSSSNHLDHEEGTSAQGHCEATVSVLDSLLLGFISVTGKVSSSLLNLFLGEFSDSHNLAGMTKVSASNKLPFFLLVFCMCLLRAHGR